MRAHIADDTRVLEYVEVYSIDDELGPNAEVFSRQFLVSAERSDADIINRVCPEDELDPSLRSEFEPNLHQTAASRHKNEDVED